MKRFVSYLYLIHNNQKLRNAGFARVELRNGRNRIDIHLQGSEYAGKSGTVYLFIRNRGEIEKNSIEGIPIGTIRFHNNQADFRYEQPGETISDSPFRIEQMNGLLVAIDGQIAYMSQWDEEPVNTFQFGEWKQKNSEQDEAEQIGDSPGYKKKTSEIRSDSPDQVERTKSTMTGMRTNEERTEGYGAGQEETAETVQHGGRMLEAVVQEIRKDEAEAGEKNDGEDDKTVSSAELKTTARQPAGTSWEQTWRTMLLQFPVMRDFPGNEDTLCVRIEPKDMRLLPEKYWNSMQNSFLLHGFFNYRYLVFGRIGKKWMLGVPGIYQNQEHVMASIFGFPDFLLQNTSEGGDGQFGYWYRILEETPD